MEKQNGPHGNNVLPFTFPRGETAPPIRLSPEHDGMELVYSSSEHPGSYLTMSILAWARLTNGKTVGVVPWYDQLVYATNLGDALKGSWAGYRLPGYSVLHDKAPIHKVQELSQAVNFIGRPDLVFNDRVAIQEIPDTLGTHAVFAEENSGVLDLREVVSWRLFADGRVAAMVADEELVTQTPVLPGDDCLRVAQDEPDFRYFYEYKVANLLKGDGPKVPLDSDHSPLDDP